MLTLHFRTSRIILKRYGESGQPCLVPDFRGIALSFSPFSLMLAVGLLYIAYVQFVYMVGYIDGFLYVQPTLHPGDEAYLIIVDEFSDMFLDSICQYFIENFCINVHEGYWSVVPFLNCVFVWLGYQVYKVYSAATNVLYDKESIRCCLKMDDDDFGGFEAAETFDGEHSGNQAMSPAVPWATFPTVSGVHLSPASPELILDHDHTSPSSGRLSSDAVISSPDDTRADSGLVSQTIPKAQIQQSAHTHLNIPLFPLGLTDEASHGSIALEDDPEGPGADVASAQLQQKISSLETKLKASEEEKLRIKKVCDVDSLMEKHSVLEEGFLKEKEQDAVSFQARYRELQEKHKQELEDMRKAGHEALSIIVDEYKALLQSSVKQQLDAIEKQYMSAIEKQAHRCEELLHAQHQRLLEVLDTEKELLREKIQEALAQQSQEQKETLGKYLQEEVQKNKETLESAVRLEKETMKDVITKAVEEERKNLEKVHAQERELWKAEHARDEERVAEAVQAAIQEQRVMSQEAVKAAIIEEQKRSEKAMEEAVKRTRDELVEYVREQRRLDQVTRQRSLTSLELFLSCAQKQLSALIATEPKSKLFYPSEDVPGGVMPPTVVAQGERQDQVVPNRSLNQNHMKLLDELYALYAVLTANQISLPWVLGMGESQRHKRQEAAATCLERLKACLNDNGLDVITCTCAVVPDS
ncbi:coiled-coil domain-containing protein 91 [Cricetulus griseus]|nr:coiled-coil domain-containing protein 91 [Cricetulus griseus]